ncbi:MAG: hypothetical protein AAGE59_37675 [Cyanobacteria bacterium P01_F01_bin.86]
MSEFDCRWAPHQDGNYSLMAHFHQDRGRGFTVRGHPGGWRIGGGSLFGEWIFKTMDLQNNTSDLFPGESINIYSEDNAIGFVFKDEEWAKRFYLEAILRNQQNFRLNGKEVIRKLRKI